MKYVIYLRVSTEGQKESGLGIEAQQKACLDYINRNGGGDYEIYKDEAVSGKLRMEDREELTNAIEALEKGDIFLVSSRDRIGRNVVQNAITEREVEKKKCKIVAVMQESTGLDVGVAQLMKTLMDAFAEYEGYLISKRVKDALARKKARGERIGHVPYGKRLVNGKLVVESEEKRAVDCIVMLGNMGNTCRQIAKQLNEKGFKNRNNTPWTYGAVNRIYKNNVIT